MNRRRIQPRLRRLPVVLIAGFVLSLHPPPYSTANGTVLNDRRVYLDRRASWVNDFFMDISEREQR